jgi:hypothetical protein
MNSNAHLVPVLALVAAVITFPASIADAGPDTCDAGAPELAVPPGHTLAFALDAEGEQIYACAGDPAPAWTLQAPRATLLGRHGQPAGTHYAGPTWRAADGSSVVATKVAAATPDASAVPWLLLRATSHAEQGRMTRVSFVQRVETSGGLAPGEGCSEASRGATVRVPYRARYCFYRPEGE